MKLWTVVNDFLGRHGFFFDPLARKRLPKLYDIETHTIYKDAMARLGIRFWPLRSIGKQWCLDHKRGVANAEIKKYIADRERELKRPQDYYSDDYLQRYGELWRKGTLETIANMKLLIGER